jgi:hypothetical protein
MMELQEEITSFVDNELRDPGIILQMNRLIYSDCLIRDEYLVQYKIKQLLKNRFAYYKLPNRVYDKILVNLKKGTIN